MIEASRRQPGGRLATRDKSLGAANLRGPSFLTERSMKMQVLAIAACLVGTGTYARAYDYVDARGYRHWCQLSCERKGIHVPKSDQVKSGGLKAPAGKIVDESDLAWEPPPGVKWQVVPEAPAPSERSLFRPSAVAKQDPRP